MTFLELVQALARESGTISAEPATVINQTGRVKLCVGWTKQAHDTIQRSRTWRWMVGAFDGASNGDARTVVGQQRYTGTGMSLTRWASWVYDPDDTYSGMSLYSLSGGNGGEIPLRHIPWDDMQRRYLIGTQPQQQPHAFSVSPAGELVLYPVPDDVYVLRGEYRKTPQTLAVDADVPEMPEQHHDVIWRAALLYLSAYDENGAQIQPWQVFRVEGMDALIREQMPQMRWFP